MFCLLFLPSTDKIKFWGAQDDMYSCFMKLLEAQGFAKPLEALDKGLCETPMGFIEPVAKRHHEVYCWGLQEAL